MKRKIEVREKMYFSPYPTYQTRPKWQLEREHHPELIGRLRSKTRSQSVIQSRPINGQLEDINEQ